MPDNLTPPDLPHVAATDAKPLALLPFIGERVEAWQIHRCQVTEGLISQHTPMKLIYHYEHLDEAVKAEYPLQGALLAQFDQLMTRERFAQLLGMPLELVPMPWQLKFSGKLVVFYANPEIALRLHWTNTLKAAEPVYHADLATAIDQCFTHWQFVHQVEVVNKNPQIVLTAALETQEWQRPASPQFEGVPAPIALAIQQFLHQHTEVQHAWLAAIKDSAQHYSEGYRLANAL